MRCPTCRGVKKVPVVQQIWNTVLHKRQNVTTWAICPECHGKGTVPTPEFDKDRHEKCPQCHGKKSVATSSGGRTACPKCLAAGFVDKPTPPPQVRVNPDMIKEDLPPANLRCPACGGRKKITTITGRDSQGLCTFGEKTCPGCDGTGLR